jgi:4-nitrophenyl phosphatase
MDHSGVVLDVDGTVVRGDEPIPGAREGLDLIREAGLDRLFVSNNPTKAPPAYVDRLGKAGFDVREEEVVTAGTVATSYLSDHHADDRLFLVGEDGLREQFTAADLHLTDDPGSAEVVVASIDRDFHFDDLTDAYEALSDESVPLVGTDPDRVIPAPERDIPGSGAIVNAVAGVAERDPDTMLGKPSDPARRIVLDRLGFPGEECLVVGDRLDTDVEFGRRAGMTTVLVTTGITDRQRVERSAVDPDYVIDSLAELDGIL